MAKASDKLTDLIGKVMAKKQTPELVYSEGYEQAKALVKKREAALTKAQEKLAKVEKISCIECCHCGNIEPIATQLYIQTHWYTPPHGCTGGDYWSAGEANWICPKCGYCNRWDGIKDKYATMPNDFYRPEIIAVKYKFRRVHDCYCRRDYSYGDGYCVCDNCQKAMKAGEKGLKIGASA